ncbi:MAG: FAD-dependent oxidoreductase [Minicystis sp.]
MFPSHPFDCRLVETRPLTPGVRALVFERCDSAPFLFEPGQWVNLVLPLPEGEIKRAYSIASPPIAGSPRFELAITRVEGGPGSTYLHTHALGQTLRAIGPQGLFNRGKAEDEPSLFVATGTGITPFRSMISAAITAGSRSPLHLLFGARFEEDILYRDEFESWAKDHPHVRYAITLSRGAPGWTGKRGYVQTHVAEMLRELRAAGGGVEPHAYICGLERMVSSVKDLLRGELALPRKHVHTERYD